MILVTIFDYPSVESTEEPTHGRMLLVWIHQALLAMLHGSSSQSFQSSPRIGGRFETLSKIKIVSRPGGICETVMKEVLAFETYFFDSNGIRTTTTATPHLICFETISSVKGFGKEEEEYVSSKDIGFFDFKLFVLCKQPEPFIFFDLDAIIVRPDKIGECLAASADKPVIAVNHQSIPNHTSHFPFKFLNGGVWIVSDPAFLDLQGIRKTRIVKHCPGMVDQKEIWNFLMFEKRYDYTHPKIHAGWNACAGYVCTSSPGKGDSLKETSSPPPEQFFSNGLPQEPVQEVFVIHFWDEFKPWKRHSPIYNQLLKRVEAIRMLFLNAKIPEEELHPIIMEQPTQHHNNSDEEIEEKTNEKIKDDGVENREKNNANSEIVGTEKKNKCVSLSAKNGIHFLLSAPKDSSVARSSISPEKNDTLPPLRLKRSFSSNASLSSDFANNLMRVLFGRRTDFLSRPFQIAEIGVGDGSLSCALLKYYGNIIGTYWGAYALLPNISKEVAESKIKSFLGLNLDALRFRWVSVLEEPCPPIYIPDGSLDVVIVNDCQEDQEYLEKEFLKWHRKLSKPSGIFAFCLPKDISKEHHQKKTKIFGENHEQIRPCPHPNQNIMIASIQGKVSGGGSADSALLSEYSSDRIGSVCFWHANRNSEQEYQMALRLVEAHADSAEESWKLCQKAEWLIPGRLKPVFTFLKCQREKSEKDSERPPTKFEIVKWAEMQWKRRQAGLSTTRQKNSEDFSSEELKLVYWLFPFELSWHVEKNIEKNREDNNNDKNKKLKHPHDAAEEDSRDDERDDGKGGINSAHRILLELSRAIYLYSVYPFQPLIPDGTTGAYVPKRYRKCSIAADTGKWPGAKCFLPLSKEKDKKRSTYCNLTDMIRYLPKERRWQIKCRLQSASLALRDQKKPSRLPLASPAHIGVIVASTSRRTHIPSIDDCPLVRTLLPNLKKAVEFCPLLRLSLFIGMDEGDTFYEDNIDTIARASRDRFGIPLFHIFIQNHRKSPVDAWNAAFDLAAFFTLPAAEAGLSSRGFEYYLQVGDDIEFNRPSVVSELVSLLRENGNRGLSWPIDDTMSRIATQCMVTREHYEMFGFFFDPHIPNWKCDDWITEVYLYAEMCYATKPNAMNNIGGRPRYRGVYPNPDMYEECVIQAIRKIVERKCS